MSADENITEEEFHENSKRLLWAASVGDNLLCLDLLRAGADPDFEDKDNQGKNPLMWAALKAMLYIFYAFLYPTRYQISNRRSEFWLVKYLALNCRDMQPLC